MECLHTPKYTNNESAGICVIWLVEKSEDDKNLKIKIIIIVIGLWSLVLYTVAKEKKLTLNNNVCKSAIPEKRSGNVVVSYDDLLNNLNHS